MLQNRLRSQFVRRTMNDETPVEREIMRQAKLDEVRANKIDDALAESRAKRKASRKIQEEKALAELLTADDGRLLREQQLRKREQDRLISQWILRNPSGLADMIREETSRIPAFRPVTMRSSLADIQAEASRLGIAVSTGDTKQTILDKIRESFTSRPSPRSSFYFPTTSASYKPPRQPPGASASRAKDVRSYASSDAFSDLDV